MNLAEVFDPDSLDLRTGNATVTGIYSLKA